MDVGEKLKIVLVGDSGVGKSALVVAYTTNGWFPAYQPTAFDNYEGGRRCFGNVRERDATKVVVSVDGRPLRLQLCDTAGQRSFSSVLRSCCYPSTDVFLFVYSLARPDSLHSLVSRWLPEVRRHAPRTPIVLVGTQSDSPAARSHLDLRAISRIGASAHIQCSALTQHNLKQVFDAVIVEALRGRRKMASDAAKPAKNVRSSLWKLFTKTSPKRVH